MFDLTIDLVSKLLDKTYFLFHSSFFFYQEHAYDVIIYLILNDQRLDLTEILSYLVPIFQ